MDVPIKERLGVNALTVVIMNFNSDGIDKYDEIVSALITRGSYTDAPKKLEFDLKNIATHLAIPSIEDPLVVELEALPIIFVMHSWRITIA